MVSRAVQRRHLHLTTVAWKALQKAVCMSREASKAAACHSKLAMLQKGMKAWVVAEVGFRSLLDAPRRKGTSRGFDGKAAALPP